MIKFIKQRYYLLDISFGNYAVCGDVLVTCLADIHLSSSHQQGGLTAAQCWLASLVSKQTFQHAQLTHVVKWWSLVICWAVSPQCCCTTCVLGKAIEKYHLGLLN